MIIGFFVGFVLAVVANRWFASWAVKFLTKRGHLAIAVYCDKKNRWKIRGNYLTIAHTITAINEGRRPGAVKYVD